MNRVVTGETDWTEIEDDGGSWLYRIVPELAAGEVPTWLIGEPAMAWTQRQYQRVREQLAAGPQLAGTMADGGELPAGILARLDDAAWTAFDRAVLGN